MGAKGMVSFIAIVALLFPLAATIVSKCYRNTQQQLPLGNLSNLEGTMDEETFELLRTNCGAEFTHLVEALQDLESNGIDKVPLEKERSMLDCLRVESPIPVPIRRKLAESNCEPHCTEETPKQNGQSQSLDIEPIPFAVIKADGDESGITNTTIIIAVVSTSVVTFLLATLLFCWYTKSYSGVQNDEKPLLSLSMSSSQKPTYSGQKSNKGFGNGGDNLMFTKSDIKKTISSVNSSVSLGIPLDPPPGNLIASGIAPLKPPPGRPDLALKAPPGMKDLHTPPLNAGSPPSRSPAGGGGAAAAPVLSPSAAPLSLHGPSRAASARRPPLAAPPPPPPSGKAPPPPPPLKQGPRPPPPPGGGVKGPPRPPGVGLKTTRPSPGDADGDDSNKAKLKPFFWDKVMASPDQAMVWHQIRAGSFQFNEEMIENLFGYNEKNKGSNRKSSSQDPSSNIIQIIDGKKAQNLSIHLKAINITTNEVCDALKEGNELPVELIQTLLKMAPSVEEEMKLRLYDGDLSRLGTAEKFLKRLVEIPFAFKRLETLLFMCTLQEEQDIIKEYFQTLESACKELKKSRLFLKLLEAVLKTGNRMNDGTFRGSAQAFKLDTLLKLSDVKGVDGKTTLLHFVVLEIIRAEGIRVAKSNDLLEEAANSSQDTNEYYRNLGLQEVSRLCGELEDVKKAATIDSDGLTGTVSKFGNALVKARDFLDTDLKNLQENNSYDDDSDEDEDEFPGILSGFVQSAEKDIMWMLEEEKRIMALVKKTADYFHGQAGKDEGLRLFVIVRDFLIILDKVCKEIKETPLKPPPKPIQTKLDEKKDGSPRRTTEVKKDGSPRRMTEEKKDGSPCRTTEEKKDGSPGRTTEEKKDGSPRRTTEEKDGSPRRTTEENKDGSPRRTTDGSPRRTTEEKKNGSPRRTTEEKKDGSPHRTTEKTKYVLSPRMTQMKDVSSPRTRENDDLPCRTRESDDLKRETRGGEGFQDSWKNEDPQEVDDLQDSWSDDSVGHEKHESGGPLEVDDLQDSWRNEDVMHEKQDNEALQEVDDLQDSWRNEDLGHEKRENEDPQKVDDLQDSSRNEDRGHEKQDNEVPREVDDLQDSWRNEDVMHEKQDNEVPQEVDDLQDSWRNEDLGHEKQENEEPREVDDLQDSWRNEDMGDEKQESAGPREVGALQDSWKDEDPRHGTRESEGPQEVDGLQDSWRNGDLGHVPEESQSPQEVDDLQDSWKNEDQKHETRESEDPPHEIEENYDLLHETQEIKSPYKIEKSDDLGHETLERDDSQHKTHDDDYDDNDDDDALQPTTREDEDLEIKRQELDDSQHKTHDDGDDDDLQSDTSWEDEDFEVKTQELDNSQLKTLEDDDMEPKPQENEHMQPKTLEDEDLQNETQETNDLQPETQKKDDFPPSELLPSGFHTRTQLQMRTNSYIFFVYLPVGTQKQADIDTKDTWQETQKTKQVRKWRG
ncbi:unnamed protein product [Lactuca virosa]|uniref:Formin-like protein n=1 Tax=Lactuca virosa TaxID=75947 RepID=A0AAU9PHM8_9ASTR|nr:unnamed protein product [Lactuca virosa]